MSAGGSGAVAGLRRATSPRRRARPSDADRDDLRTCIVASPAVGVIRPPRAVIRRDMGMWAIEAALQRQGFDDVAGVDEAGRGACAGPLVVAACVLPPGKRGRVPELADS